MVITLVECLYKRDCGENDRASEVVAVVDLTAFVSKLKNHP